MLAALPGKGRAAGLELDKCRQPYEIWNHRVMESLRLEKTSEIIECSP